jgi:hypothetical protein
MGASNVIQKCGVLLLCMRLLTGSAFGQGSAEVISDPGVERLMASRLAQRQASGGKIPGYRILLSYSGSRATAERQAEEARLFYMGKYDIIVMYDEPNFKVYLGEYRQRWEADVVLREVQKQFRGARVIPDRIRLPLLAPPVPQGSE